MNIQEVICFLLLLTVATSYSRSRGDYSIKVERNGIVKVQCYVKSVNLTSINVAAIGPANEFSSSSCNLRNQLALAFKHWGIESTRKWDMEDYSDVDFVLGRSEFEGVNVSRVETIAMENSNIVEIQSDAFQDFVRLEEINLQSNKIKVLPDLFKHSHFVRVVNIARNQLDTLPEMLSAPSLTHLELWKNNLTRLSETLFSKTLALKVIDLHDNKIEELPDKLLHPLLNLEKIDITLNNVTKVSSDFFRMNKNMTYIRLSNMNVSSLPENFFEGLTELEEIRLPANSLESLPENLFQSLEKLSFLYLNDNKLTHLPSTILHDSHHLRILDLSNNNLSGWPIRLSNYKRVLHTLRLEGNNFERIGSNPFRRMTRLKHLHLQENNISYIAGDAFADKRFLVLNLSRNSLTDVADEMSFTNTLLHSRFLFLDHNLFERIPHLAQYKTIYLSITHNRIKEIDMRDFINTTRVDLNDNQIEVIDFKFLNATGGVLKEGPQVPLAIGNNPIMCGCSAYQLIQFFDKTYENEDIYKKFSLDGDLTCRGPPSLAGRNVRELKAEALSSCDHSQQVDYRDFDGCPSNCYCEINLEKKSLSLDCSNGNLTNIPPVPVITKRNIDGNASIVFERVHMNLENNSMEEFGKDISYENVTVLNLSNNKLAKVDWIPPKIEVLNLRDNFITSLDNETILRLKNSATLREMILDNNPCDCDFMIELEKVMHDNAIRNASQAFNSSSTLLFVLICLSLLIDGVLNY